MPSKDHCPEFDPENRITELTGCTHEDVEEAILHLLMTNVTQEEAQKNVQKASTQEVKRLQLGYKISKQPLHHISQHD